MGFVPDLIPEEWRVLPEYFRKKPLPIVYKGAKRIFLVVAAIFCFLLGLGVITHPLLTLIMWTLGLLLLPAGQRWIEEKMRFRFTPLLKRAAAGTLALLFFFGIGYYASTEAPSTKVAGIKSGTTDVSGDASTIAKASEADSFRYYLDKTAAVSAKPDAAFKFLAEAAFFARTDEEKTALAGMKDTLLRKQAEAFSKKGRYADALPLLSALIEAHPSDTVLLFQRAVCHVKQGATKDAVADLRTAIAEGSHQADRYHDQINPERRRVAYYVTRCCDGSTSGASGRGACSHHGGVCNWNDPVYEEYRKY